MVGLQIEPYSLMMVEIETSLIKQLLEIWRLRMLQKRSEAMLVFEGVEMSGAEPKEKLLHSLLQVSFLRAEGKLDEADEVLASTQKQKHLLPSKFYHQKGLQEIIRLKYAAALENFILAAKYADCVFDRIVAEASVLNGLYTFSKPCLRKLNDVEKLINECDDEDLVIYIKNFIQQWSIRTYFWQGETHKVEAEL